MRWPFQPRARKSEAKPLRAGPLDQSVLPDAELVEAIATEHLPVDLRQRWLSMLRPAVRLVPRAPGASYVARLGGLPDLPEDEPWPTWSGVGPLSYIGEVLCEGLAGLPLDIAIPPSGRLLFFYFDGSYDDGNNTVGYWDPETMQGARALYVPAGTSCSRRPVPEGIAEYREQMYAGRSILTPPGWEHPDLREAFMEPGEDHRSFMQHPVNADDFAEALHERHQGPLHQIGGYAEPVQGPVEHEVALAALDNRFPHGDPRTEEEARRWELLFQVDTDDELAMMWGDAGVLYWLARPEALADRDLSDVSFTWQCS